MPSVCNNPDINVVHRSGLWTICPKPASSNSFCTALSGGMERANTGSFLVLGSFCISCTSCRADLCSKPCRSTMTASIFGSSVLQRITKYPCENISNYLLHNHCKNSTQCLHHIKAPHDREEWDWLLEILVTNVLREIYKLGQQGMLGECSGQRQLQIGHLWTSLPFPILYFLSPLTGPI